MANGVWARLAPIVAFIALGCGGQTLASNENYAGSGAGAGGTSAGGAGAGGTSAGGAGAGGTLTGGAGGCDLAELAAGPLPTQDQAGRTGPGVVATDTGFVIGYREALGASLQARVLYVSDAGVVSAPEVFALGGCATTQPKDGVALAYAKGMGLLATSLPDCGTGAGAVFVPFDASGVTTNASAPKNASFYDLTLARSGALAPAVTPGEYELVYRVVSTSGTSVERVVLQGPAFKNVPIEHPYGDGDLPFGMIATSKTTRAVLAPDLAKSSLILKVGPMTSDTIDSEWQSVLPMSASPAMVVWGDRVAVAVPVGGTVMLRVLERSPGGLETLSEPILGVPVSDEVRLAVLDDHLLVASVQQSQITLTVFTGAVSSPSISPAGTHTLDLPLPPALRVGLAAARGRVALTWLSNSTGSMPMGGWKLLGCGA